MKRNTKQLFPMILVFTIIAAAYSCRMLAMLDIGGTWMSYIRAALYLLLFSLWGYSLDRRIIQTQALHCLRLTAALMLVWLILRTLKYEFVTDLTVARYIWYLYYLPMLFIPLLGVYIALSLGKSEEYRLTEKAGFLVAVPGILFLLVITNDLHQQVVAFSSGMCLEVVLADGTEIDARGTNRFPKNYSSFVQELCKLITTERISSVHFSDGTYEITLPESWVGTVAASFSESQVAFFVDKLGGELTFFIIDSDTYGYAPDSYKGRIEVGRLISGEDVRFITARDNYAIASYASEVSEEALGLWKNYESDKLSIVESLRGVNGYAFYPDAIAAKRQDLR